MGAAEKIKNYTLEEYLKAEKETGIKHEYHNGYITAMAGGTPHHSLIQGNMVTALNNAIRAASKPCRTYTSDAKIAIEAANRYYYPDASVVCGQTETSERNPHAIANPVLIIEVISESSEGFDRGEKFYYYRQLSSLEQYVLINQEHAIIEVYSRQKANIWQLQTIEGLETKIPLDSIDCEIAMADVYRQVEGIEEA